MGCMTIDRANSALLIVAHGSTLNPDWNSSAQPSVAKRGSRSGFVLWLSARAPFNGRLIEAECLDHKRGRFVEVLYRCAGPISCRASAGVTITSQCNPFSSSQHVADTDRFLRV